MTKTELKKLIAAKDSIVRGDVRPARVTEVLPDGKGGFTRREIDPGKMQAQFKREWSQHSIARTREKLGLSQGGFAKLIGISVRTLQQWEQGRAKPSGAARVLLRVAAIHPKAVLEAA